MFATLVSRNLLIKLIGCLPLPFFIVQRSLLFGLFCPLFLVGYSLKENLFRVFHSHIFLNQPSFTISNYRCFSLSFPILSPFSHRLLLHKALSPPRLTSALKMEAISSSEKLVLPTRCHNPEDFNLSF